MDSETLGGLVLLAVIAYAVWALFFRRRTKFTHEGQTYYRNRDGSFADRSGTPIRDAALIATLTAGYAAWQADSGSNALDHGDSGGDGGGGGD